MFDLKALVYLAEDGRQVSWWWATLLVLGMFLTSVLQSLAQHHCFTQGQKLGMKIRANVCHSVYKKVGVGVGVREDGGRRGRGWRIWLSRGMWDGLGFSSVREIFFVWS